MIRIPDFRTLLKQDLKGSPSWVEVLLGPINQMIEFLLNAFKGNISVQNLNVQTLTIPVTAPFQMTRFAKTKPDPIYGVFLNQIMKDDGTVVGALTGIDWYEDGNSFVVTNIFGLTNGVKYQVKLMVLY